MVKKLASNTFIQWAAYVAFPLGLGAIFYRLFRSKRPIILGDGPALELSQPIVLQAVPSLLWSFALTAAMLLIWKPAHNFGVIAVAGIAVLVSLLFEIWQAADIGLGTFDCCDGLFSIAGCLLSTLIFKRTYSK
jgi:hypothetical protein